MGESEDSPPATSHASSHNGDILFERVENLIAEAQNNLQENLNLRKLLEESQILNKKLETRMQTLKMSSAQPEHRLFS
jgi:hypothetical protein